MVRIHWHRLGLRGQQPCYQALAQDKTKVKQFLDQAFKDIQEVAQAMHADVAFEDESWIQANTRSGRTGGLGGQPPNITVTDRRSGFPVRSMVTAAGALMYKTTRETMESATDIQFLEKVLSNRPRPFMVSADQAAYHTSGEGKDFIEKHHQRIRLFFLPPQAPELNPDEQVWNEITHRQLEKQPIKNRKDFKTRVDAALKALKECKEKVKSFFQLKDTKYASLKPSPA